jgi:copper resistance protein C
VIGLLRGVTALVLSAAVAVGAATAAAAHTELRRSDPAVGQTLTRAPRAVTLTFSGPVLAVGAIVRVMGPGGEVGDRRPTVRGATVTQPLNADLPNGSYITSWRLSANDGHVQSGTLTFLLAAAGEPSSTAGVGTPPATTTAAGPAPVAVPSSPATHQHPMQADEPGSLPLGWVIFGLLVLALVIAGAVLSEVRRRRRLRAAAPRGRPTD